MPLYKTTVRATVDIDIWYIADSEQHATTLALENDPSNYTRIRSAVDFSTGAIRVDNSTIQVLTVTEEN